MRSIIFAALFMVSTAAFAAGDGAAARPPLAVAAITAQQTEIRDGVIAGTGRYKALSPSKRADLLAKQASLLMMLEGKTSTADLTETQRVEAFNTLEWIEATINNTDDERMVCRREKALGSNRLVRVCKTVEQDRIERENARKHMEEGRLLEQ